MSSTIKLTPEELAGYAAQMKTAATTLSEILSELDGKVAKCMDSWEGDAYKALYDSYQKVRADAMKAPEIAFQIGEGALSAANRFSETDKRLASKFG